MKSFTKLLRSCLTCLFISTVMLSVLAPARVEARVTDSIFKGSWLNDDSLYWTDGGVGMLPDEFTLSSASLNTQSISYVSTAVSNANVDTMVLAKSTAEQINIMNCFAGYVNQVYQTATTLATETEKYNSDPGENTYSALVKAITKANCADAIISKRNELAAYASSIASTLGMNAAQVVAEPGYYGLIWYYGYIDSIVSEYASDEASIAYYKNMYLPKNPNGLYESSAYMSQYGGYVIDTLYDACSSTISIINTYNIYAFDFDDTSRTERSLSSIVRFTGQRIRSLLEHNGIDIPTIVFGRVRSGGGNPVAVNSFQFELEFKNIYGIIGAILYSILSYPIAFGIVLLIMFSFTKISFANSAKVKEAVKDNLGYFIISLLLLKAIPQLVDILVYLKDIILSILGTTLSQFSPDENVIVNLTEKYYETAATSESFFDACIFLGFVILSAYFAVVYIAAACSLTIVFGFSPIFILLGIKNKEMMGTWLKFILGVVMTPIIDCALLYVPSLAQQLHSPQFLSLILCFSIIPARGVIKKLLGFGQSVGAEAVGIGAMMVAGRSIGSLARNGKNIISKTRNNLQQASADRANARIEENLAEIEDIMPESKSSGGFSASNRVNSIGEFKPERLNFNSDEDYLAARETALRNDRAYKEATGMSGHSVDAVDTKREADRATEIKNSEGLAEYNKTNDYMAAQQRYVQATYAKYANPSNFENAAIFSNLTHQQKAALYRRKAAYNTGEAIGTAVGGTAGAVMGGSVGMAAGTWLGPDKMLAMGAVGAELGMSAGDDAGSAVGRGIGSAVGSLANTYTVNDADLVPPVLESQAEPLPDYTDFRSSPHRPFWSDSLIQSDSIDQMLKKTGVELQNSNISPEKFVGFIKDKSKNYHDALLYARDMGDWEKTRINLQNSVKRDINGFFKTTYKNEDNNLQVQVCDDLSQIANNIYTRDGYNSIPDEKYIAAKKEGYDAVLQKIGFDLTGQGKLTYTQLQGKSDAEIRKLANSIKKQSKKS